MIKNYDIVKKKHAKYTRKMKSKAARNQRHRAGGVERGQAAPKSDGPKKPDKITLAAAIRFFGPELTAGANERYMKYIYSGDGQEPPGRAERRGGVNITSTLNTGVHHFA